MTHDQGYYRFPTISDGQICFVSEDDLWTVALDGGVARRLTTSLGWAGQPRYSPDGASVAFTGVEDGQPEVYVMPAGGGRAQRLTWLGAMTNVVGWTPDGRSVVFRSNAAAPMAHLARLHTVPVTGGPSSELPYGVASEVAFGPRGAVVLGRWTGDPARWKRYRGGRAGILLVDRRGKGDFAPLVELPGNLAAPMWVGDRIVFLSDHEGVGNLYSCTVAGDELVRHTHHEDFYVRTPTTDGRRVVYSAGGDLHLLDPASGENRPVTFVYPTPRTQTARRFVSATSYMEDTDLHPAGHSVALTARGKAFTLAHWDGPVHQAGETDGVRYRLVRWLPDGAHLVMLSDAGGREGLEIHAADGSTPPRRLKTPDLGRPFDMEPSPTGDRVAVTNNRNELWVVELKTGKALLVDRSDHFLVHGFDWSSDGRWLAYTLPVGPKKSQIFLAEIPGGRRHPVTTPDYFDAAPAFDPDGKYLYFLSYRRFDPVFDFLTFDYTFPLGCRPYMVTLRADIPSPFTPEPRAPGQQAPVAGAEAPLPGAKKEKKGKKSKAGEAGAKPRLRIDVEGLSDRILAFPVGDGLYGGLRGLSGGRLLYMSFPLEGRLDREWFSDKPEAKANLHCYELLEGKHDVLVKGLSDYRISIDGKTLLYRSGNRLRALKAGDKADDATARDGASRKSGWVDLGRIRLSLCPAREWLQMFDEAWRLARENFWTENMSGVDWQGVARQYRPLVARVGSRGEFSDLMWEVQGELGTSHAYEFGGDYRQPPRYPVGHLGATLVWEPKAKGYRVDHVVCGDPWNEEARSPLAAPGVGVVEDDVITAVDGVALSATLTPGEALLHRAGVPVTLTVKPRRGRSRSVVVKPLRSDLAARYREWVEANRALVHEATGGRVGYIHVPDCGARGYSEFHRSFLQEADRDGLIVDIRFNGGGHVSSLLLEKLARRRIAYCKPRWGRPSPYPTDAPAGPMVALTNECAGSDGDIFSHSFKLMGLGPLIGKRTWGGVIGITVRDVLVDRSITTQPQFSFWFSDVGWAVENYGTDPDIEVDVTPADWREGRDPQLARGIEEIRRILAEQPPVHPTFEGRPNLARPVLPDTTRTTRGRRRR